MTAPALDAGQQRALARARAALRTARNRLDAAPMHRSLRKLSLGPLALAEAIAITAMLTAAVWLARPEISQVWQDIVLALAAWLELPLAVVRSSGATEWVYGSSTTSMVPGPVTGAVTAAVVIGSYSCTYFMPQRMVPVKYLVRMMCIVQASALLFFMAVPSRFPYSVGSHVVSILQSGIYLMLAMPVMLGMGYAVLRVPLHWKLIHPALMLAYFAVMLPVKVVLHVLVLQYLSVLFMPLLYLCFGLVFDLLVFVALYSWVVSGAPQRAVGR